MASHALTQPGPTLPTQLPSRVRPSVMLEVGVSGIPRAGRGLFIQSDVKAGDMIFSIENPLLCVVNDTDMARARVCDYCFAGFVKLGEMKLATSLIEDLHLKRCSRCDVLDYCSVACQRAAWRAYHKSECRILTKCKEIDNARERNTSGVQSSSILLRPLFRLFVRLFSTHELQTMAVTEWAELLSMYAANGPGISDEGLIRQLFATRLPGFLDEQKKEELIRLWVVISVTGNAMPILQPVLKGDRNYVTKCRETPFIVSGYCLDPFAALINHQCDPNSFIVFEGRELRVRAMKDIAAGSEITICYEGADTNDDYNYRTRKLTREEFWTFKCACRLCEGPNRRLQLDGANGLHDRAWELIGNFESLNMLYPTPEITSELERIVKEIDDGTNVEYGVAPVRRLHLCLLRGYSLPRLLNADLRPAYKLAVKLWFNIEEAQNPPTFPQYRLKTLLDLLALLFLSCRRPGASMSETAFAIHENRLYFFLCKKLVADTKKWLGEDSIAAKREEELWEQSVQIWQGNTVYGHVLTRFVNDGPFVNVTEAFLFLRVIAELISWSGGYAMYYGQLIQLIGCDYMVKIDPGACLRLQINGREEKLRF